MDNLAYHSFKTQNPTLTRVLGCRERGSFILRLEILEPQHVVRGKHVDY